jgi:type IV pilus assembly protein PilF
MNTTFKRSAATVMVWMLALLSGCGTVSNSNRQDIVTESDESDVAKRARLRLELAAGYFEQAKYTIALDEIKQSLSIQPGNVEALNLRGLIYMRMNDSALAEDSFRRALSLDPSNGSVLHNYGWFLCGASREKEAHDQFDRALKSTNYPNAGKTHMAQAMCYQKSGKANEALNAYLRAYELEPGNPIVGYNLGLIYYQLADYNRAQFQLRRINSSDLANQQTLWLGLKIENKLGNQLAVRHLAEQLMGKFPNTDEAGKWSRGQINE